MQRVREFIRIDLKLDLDVRSESIMSCEFFCNRTCCLFRQPLPSIDVVELLQLILWLFRMLFALFIEHRELRIALRAHRNVFSDGH